MRLCFDLDGTICTNKPVGGKYEDVVPMDGMVEFMRQLKADGHYIIIQTARNMVTHNNNLGKINKHQAPIIFDWLAYYGIPYDEILFGKPHADYFIDDKGIRYTTTEELKTKLGY